MGSVPEAPPFLEYPLGGWFGVSSGPLESLTVYGPGASFYDYGSAVLTLNARWDLPDGSPAGGGFTVPLISEFAFEIDEQLQNNPNDPQSDFANGDLPFTLGRGVMDPALAKYLGVGRRILGGTLTLYVYGIDGDATSPIRYGQTYLPHLNVVIPEPGVTALVLLSLVAVSSRLRRRGRSPLFARSVKNRRRDRRLSPLQRCGVVRSGDLPLFAPQLESQKGQQYVGVVFTMLLVLGNHALYLGCGEQVGRPQRSRAQRVLEQGAKILAEPRADRAAKPALLLLHHPVWQSATHALFLHEPQPSVADLRRGGHGGHGFDEFVIEKRHTGFERRRHAHLVGQQQQAVHQRGVEIEPQHLADGVIGRDLFERSGGRRTVVTHAPRIPDSTCARYPPTATEQPRSYRSYACSPCEVTNDLARRA